MKMPPKPKKLTDSEKKTKRKLLEKKRTITRVYLGDQIKRWNKLKSANNLNSHSSVAKFLLNW